MDEWSKLLLDRFSPPDEKVPIPSPKFPIPPLGRGDFPLPFYGYLENPDMFHLSITRCRNNFHIFFSLTVNCDSV